MRDTPSPRRTVAARIAGVVGEVLGALPLRIRAWDGSEAGPAGAPTWCSPDGGLRRLLWARTSSAWPQPTSPATSTSTATWPTGCPAMWALARAARSRRPALGPTAWGGATAVRLGVVGRAAAPAGGEARLTGGKHSTRPGPGRHRPPLRPVERVLRRCCSDDMAYSSRATSTRPRDGPLDDAQRTSSTWSAASSACDRGMRLLDIGCGWGSLILPRRRALRRARPGVTISARAARLRRQARSPTRGLDRPGRRPAARLPRASAVPARPYDAVSSIEMGEHVGDGSTRCSPGPCTTCCARVGGRWCSRCPAAPPPPAADRSSRPTSPPTCTCDRWADRRDARRRPGLEVRDVHAMREHYAWTARAWLRHAGGAAGPTPWPDR